MKVNKLKTYFTLHVGYMRIYYVAIRESFLREIWSVAFFGAAEASNLRKLPNSRNFSPLKVSRYMVTTYCHTQSMLFPLQKELLGHLEP